MGKKEPKDSYSQSHYFLNKMPPFILVLVLMVLLIGRRKWYFHSQSDYFPNKMLSFILLLVLIVLLIGRRKWYSSLTASSNQNVSNLFVNPNSNQKEWIRSAYRPHSIFRIINSYPPKQTHT